MKISISEKDKSFDEITFNDGLNYGRFDSDEIEVFPYEFCIAREEFISLMSGSYKNCLEEIKADDLLCNETSAFSQMDYVGINQAFDHPEAFSEAIETYFDRELFGKAIGHSENREFVINSTERVEVECDKVTISGRCFRRQQRF
jgi:hypothetical protein